MVSILLNIYQIGLFCIFCCIFIIYILPAIKTYIWQQQMLQLERYRFLLSNLDHAKKKLTEMHKKKSDLSIEISFRNANEYQKIIQLRTSMRKNYTQHMMSYAIRQSQVLRQEQIEYIVCNLERDMLLILKNKSYDMNTNFDNCIHEMNQYIQNQ